MPIWLILSALVVCLAVSIFLLLVLPWGREEPRAPEPVREMEEDVILLDVAIESARAATPARIPSQAPAAAPPGRAEGPRAQRARPAPSQGAAQPASAGAALAAGGHPLLEAVARKVQSATLRLPVLPRSAANVLALIASPACSPYKLARSIQTDPTLTAHVLRVANSPWYAPETPVTTLELAIMRLGLNTVKDITITVAMRERLLRGDAPARRELLHATLASAFAREIAAARGSDATLASLAGLLHDVGRPALRRACGELAAELEVRVTEDALAACVDAYHEAVGARMAASWNLPPAVGAAIAHHHDALCVPEPHRELALTTQLADDLAKWALVPDGATHAIAEGPLVAALDLSDDAVLRILGARDKVLRQAKSHLA